MPIFDATMNDAPGCIGVYAGDFTCYARSAVVVSSRCGIADDADHRRFADRARRRCDAPLAFSYAGFAFAGDVSGSLDCKSNELHAEVQNGLFASEVAPIPFAFQGHIDGSSSIRRPKSSPASLACSRAPTSAARASAPGPRSCNLRTSDGAAMAMQRRARDLLQRRAVTALARITAAVAVTGARTPESHELASGNAPLSSAATAAPRP